MVEEVGDVGKAGSQETWGPWEGSDYHCLPSRILPFIPITSQLPGSLQVSAWARY